MICAECNDPFTPDHYNEVCDSCGTQLSRRYEQLQEFRRGVLDLSVIAGWAIFGMPKEERRRE